jgi:hypothetical protein
METTQIAMTSDSRRHLRKGLRPRQSCRGERLPKLLLFFSKTQCALRKELSAARQDSGWPTTSRMTALMSADLPEQGIPLGRGHKGTRLSQWGRKGPIPERKKNKIAPNSLDFTAERSVCGGLKGCHRIAAPSSLRLA